MRFFIAMAVCLSVFAACGYKPPYKACKDIRDASRSFGNSCYMDRSKLVSEKAVQAYVQNRYGSEEELKVLLQYCAMILNSAESGVGKGTAIIQAEKEFKESFCVLK